MASCDHDVPFLTRAMGLDRMVVPQSDDADHARGVCDALLLRSDALVDRGVGDGGARIVPHDRKTDLPHDDGAHVAVHAHADAHVHRTGGSHDVCHGDVYDDAFPLRLGPIQQTLPSPRSARGLPPGWLPSLPPDRRHARASDYRGVPRTADPARDPAPDLKRNGPTATAPAAPQQTRNPPTVPSAGRTSLSRSRHALARPGRTLIVGGRWRSPV
uniref:Uncharacterized protein n=1 Tax=Anopheles atroparvus TaxID=41427 RepID=A0AAG5D882_ANOAO